MLREWTALVSLISGVALSACGGGADAPANASAAVGEAELALTVVPTGVQCIRVSAGGTTTDFAVSAGSSSVLSIGRLPLGSVSVSANAYTVACASIGANTPTWISDPLTVTIRAGVVANLTLNLRQNNAVTANVNFVGNVAQVAGGESTTLFVMSDGTLRFTGYLFGNGGGVVQTTTQFTGLTNIVEVASGANHACARRSDGTVWCWGDNTYGQLGIGTVGGSFVYTPTQVIGVTGATQISARWNHTCAITDTGFYLKCWGRNVEGQLGLGNTTNTGTPTAISLFFLVDRVTTGVSHTCATEGSGTWCWGSNIYGQLGDNTTTQRNSPVMVSGSNPYIAIGAGNSHTCGVRADGAVRCWGGNYLGQLGDGTLTGRPIPTPVGGITDATHLAVGLDHACVRRQSGTLSCWGYNNFGQLGDGTADFKTSPTAVAGLTSVSYAVADSNATIALLDNQTVYAWGQNQNGQLGDGTRVDRFKPQVLPLQ